MKKSFPFSYPGLVETDRRQGITQDVPLGSTFFFSVRLAKKATFMNENIPIVIINL